jgi:hypothetical protein
MTSTATPDTDSTAAVLTGLRETQSEITRAEVRKLHLTLEWAKLNQVEEDDDYADHGFFGDQAIPVAGEGAPLVAEFAAMELAAALGMSTDAGRTYVGRVLELAYRLPRLFAKVEVGKVPVWRAFRIADHTIPLPKAGAAYVDRSLAPVAHSCSWAQLERLVEEALVRYDPEAAEAKRRQAAESRRFDVHTDRVTHNGTVPVDGVLDLADALDLDAAITHGAKQQAALGSTESLDVRRSIAAGDLVRRQLAFDYEGGFEARCARTSTTVEPSAGRSVVLFAHISEEALKGAASVGRCGNTRSPISVEQIREWCGNPDAHITVKPVIDLNDHIHVEAYEAPDRLKEQNALVDVHCVFPHCTKPARRCDTDHRIPYNKGGSTCSCNTAPLCRRHHRAKTHGRWEYVSLDRGTYLWTTPNGIQLVRDHLGTAPFTGEP